MVNLSTADHAIAYDMSASYNRSVSLEGSLAFTSGADVILRQIATRGKYGMEGPAKVLADRIWRMPTEAQFDYKAQRVIYVGLDGLSRLWIPFALDVLVPGFDDRITICPTCGKWFARKKANHLFCSSKCRVYLYRR
jgi:hypothetical protein